jgi:ankyrin repeat protein
MRVLGIAPPLFFAASHGKLENIAALVAAGVDVNARDENNWIALFYAE